MSKLAALAAKRRQKENEKLLTGESDKPEPQRTQTSNYSRLRNPRLSPPKLLDKTVGEDGPETHNLDRTEDFLVTPPISNAVRCEPQLPSVEARAEPARTSASIDPATATRASPSPFAVTIMAQDLAAAAIESSLANGFARVMSFNNPIAKPFDFTDPSPDDVVTKAQSSKGSN